VNIAHANEINVELDKDDFLKNPEDWSTAVAEYLTTEGYLSPLTDDYWKVINYLIGYYKKFGKDTGCNLYELENLFSSDCVRAAYKLAGLPKPTG